MMNILYTVDRVFRVQQGGANKTKSAEPGYEQRSYVPGRTADRRNCWRPGERVGFYLFTADSAH